MKRAQEFTALLVGATLSVTVVLVGPIAFIVRSFF